MVVCHGLLTIASAVAASLGLVPPACRTTAAPLTPVAAHALDKKNARAAPRGLHKAAGPLPGHNTNKSKTMGPADTTGDHKPAARLLGGGRRLDGHGQDG